MSRWMVRCAGEPIIQETTWSASFVCANIDENRAVLLTITQQHGGPAEDLVNACAALMRTLQMAAREDEPAPPKDPKQLN